MRLTAAIASLCLASLPLLACRHAAPSQSATPTPVPRAAEEPLARSERFAVNTPEKTVAGTTFTVPAGWSVTFQGALSILRAPEGNATLALFDTQAPDARGAVKTAWRALAPKASVSLRTETDGQRKQGFAERKDFSYETSPNEHRDQEAMALGNGHHWLVLLTDGDQGTLEKRLGQLSVVLDSVRPSGFQRETFAGKKANPLTPERIDELKRFLETAMKDAGVPGVGLAIIDHGQVVFEGGLGVRELGKPTPVDANTLFMAASNTKGMTTLLMAKLVDQGKLAWNEPVVKVYPQFKLGDAEVTPQVEVRHLICACTGMPRQDLEMLLEFSRATPESRLQLLATMKPTSKFGEVFQYSNVMASAAGFIAGHLVDPKDSLGVAYQRAMQREIFTPLGMRSTTFDNKKALAGNHATPHGFDVDGNTRVADMSVNRCIVPDAPAGGVWTSAHDFAQYVLLELHRGETGGGKRFVSEENILKRREKQVAIGEDNFYGMGLMVNNRWGVPVVHHGGDLVGFHSDFYVLPESGEGAVLLTNSDTGQLLRAPFMRKLLEVLFDGTPQAEHDAHAAITQLRAELAAERKRIVVPADPAATKGLAPRYRSDQLGEIAVKHVGEQTVFDFGEWSSSVASRFNDDKSLSFITEDPGKVGYEFVQATRDGKRALVIRDGQHEYVFLEAAGG